MIIKMVEVGKIQGEGKREKMRERNRERKEERQRDQYFTDVQIEFGAWTDDESPLV